MRETFAKAISRPRRWKACLGPLQISGIVKNRWSTCIEYLTGEIKPVKMKSLKAQDIAVENFSTLWVSCFFALG